MPVLRLFAAAREAAGVARVDMEGLTVAEVLDRARARYGDGFAAVLARSRVWVNGRPAEAMTPLQGHDVVAVLPPVSGGSDIGAPTSTSTVPAVEADAGLPSTGAGTPAPGRTAPGQQGPGSDPGSAPGAAAASSPTADYRQRLLRLAVVPGTTRPHGRIGMAWAVVTTTAAVAGPWWLAGWLGGTAFVGASQASALWRGRPERLVVPLAAATALGLPLASAVGVRAAAGAVVAAAVLAVVARLVWPSATAARDVGLTLGLGLSVGLAASAPVLVRGLGLEATLLLLASAAAYDAGAYLVGTGASSAWEGPVAGVAALIPLTILAAVVLVPPFPAGGPVVLGVAAGLLAPLGPLAGSALLGGQDADAPGLRRLDSLLLLGPVWALLAALFLG